MRHRILNGPGNELSLMRLTLLGFSYWLCARASSRWRRRTHVDLVSELIGHD